MKEPGLKITQRNLPHWELDGSVYFITFNTWEKLELTPEARQIVLSACKFFNNQRYQSNFCLGYHARSCAYADSAKPEV
jgi:hypothetical protein